MKSHHQPVQISFKNVILSWVECDMYEYHGVQLYFYFAVYIAVALLFAFISCCVSGRIGESGPPYISFSAF